MTFTTSLVLALLSLPLADRGSASDTSPVLLDFHASWCGPCRQMRPAVQRLIEKGYPVKSVDIDESPNLAARYHVSAVPTFVVVDADGRELARDSGLQPPGQLAKLYNNAVDRARATPPEPAVVPGGEQAAAADAPKTKAPAANASNVPQPWETTVRIKVMGPRFIGFGSGTIIRSTPKEAIILTCAHIFHIDGAIRQPRPAEFNRKIRIDLFDGQLHGTNPAQVHPLETDLPGEAIDYDYMADVGLIRIRPGRKLKASPVVPAEWRPQAGLKMDTVGCSEGHDATAWTTHITNPQYRGQINSRLYDAIECDFAPLQGRSGGGLFTRDGYLAGVCDFAEPQGKHGLYAAPRSIQHMLDKNNLTICYAPTARPAGTLVADAGRPSKNAPSARSDTIVRGQDPNSLPKKPAAHVATIPMPGPDEVGVTLGPIARTDPNDSSAKSNAETGSAWRGNGHGGNLIGPDEIEIAADDAHARPAPPANQPRPAAQPMNPTAMPSMPASSSDNDPLPEPESPIVPSRTGGGWKKVVPVANNS